MIAHENRRAESQGGPSRSLLKREAPRLPLARMGKRPCVMGAGVATSPHFPEVGVLAGDGRRSFPWADRVPASALRPWLAPSRVPGFALLHCRSPCSGSCPNISIRSDPDRSRRPKAALPFGRLLGKWERLGLAPAPHASSSVRPASRAFGFDPFGPPPLQLRALRRLCLLSHLAMAFELSSVSVRPLSATSGSSHDALSRANTFACGRNV